MPILPLPFHLTNHNKDAAINILIIFISIGLIILSANYFYTTTVKNEQIISQPTNAFRSGLSLAASWHNKNHAGVKDTSPVVAGQETPKLSIVLNGIVLAPSDETSFVLINEGDKRKRYSPSEALEPASGTLARGVSKISAVFEIHGHYEKVTFHPGLPDIIKQPDSEGQNALADYIIAAPMHDGGQIYGLRLNPHKGLSAFATSLPQPRDIALRIDNLSLTYSDEVSQVLSLLLTQQGTQFTIRRNSVPRLTNVSVAKLTGMNGQHNEGTQ